MGYKYIHTCIIYMQLAKFLENRLAKMLQFSNYSELHFFIFTAGNMYNQYSYYVAICSEPDA